ncbi:DUF6055 domain-containing protein [Xanthomonas campestris]|uniref:DUF6055 domain-containing protein n=1 Tax=Xanthomonas campestris TaxID=339 RepID=UPI0023585D33|nr:DUF6055 domain-containing protein [Xanthomonas campestris]MDC8746661.1 DUF6055 domain-containing protein [Xanthomonas campestris]
MSTALSRLSHGLLTAGLIAAGLGSASVATAACTAGTWTARTDEPDMPPVRYETTHFAFRWNGDPVALADVRAAGQHLETAWDYFITTLKFPEPACASSTKYKANVHLDPDFGLTGGLTASGGMGMWIGTGFDTLGYRWGRTS